MKKRLTVLACGVAAVTICAAGYRAVLRRQSPLQHLWTYNAKQAVYGPEVGGNGLVYVWSAPGWLLALDAANGGMRWANCYPGLVYGNIKAHPDGRVFILARDTGTSGTALCLNGSTGTELWRRAVPAHQLLIAGRQLVVGGEWLLGLDLNTGATRWKYRPASLKGAELSAPNNLGQVEDLATDSTRVFVSFGSPISSVHAVRLSDGLLSWQSNVPSHHQGGLNEGNLAIAGGHVLATSRDGSVCGFDKRRGELIWKSPELGYVLQLAAGSNGLAFTGSWDGKVAALDIQTGRVLWESNVGGKVPSPPVISSDGRLFVGTVPNRIRELDLATGAQLTAIELPSSLLSRLYEGGDYLCVSRSPTNVLYAGSTDGHVFAVTTAKPSP